ncbi:MAG: PCI domain-containing protein, partial [Elusimicrobiota bacterium]|nr:PCI domain-containing protein [Endomicrobiia bacterium]MDW8166308.1 PCI domain-containing protein [Elusimicrobiota bacterium]
SHISIKPLSDYDYKDELFLPLVSLSDIKEFIESNSRIVELIRKIGEENYKKYFLGYENFSFDEISQLTGLSKKEVEDIFEFTNEIFIKTEINSQRSSLDVEELLAKKYIKVAKIEKSGNSFVIIYLTPSMFRGGYIIDYDKLYEVLKTVTSKKKREIKKIVKEIEMLKLRKMTFHRMLENIILIQKDFINTEDKKDLKLCTQKDLASKINVSSSTISRLSKERSVVLPSGREYPIENFFVNKKRLAMIFICDILNKHRTLKDSQIKELLYQQLKIKYSRRSINYYKNLIKKSKTKDNFFSSNK